MKKNLLIVSLLVIIAAGAGYLFWQSGYFPPAASSTPKPGAAAFAATAATQKISHNDAEATVDIEYPELSISGVPERFVSKMNADIASGTIAFEKDFFDQVSVSQADMASLPAEVPRDSEAYRRFKVFSSPAFGTVSVLYSDEEMFPGDAHPANFFHSAVYDVLTGKPLADTDIVSAANAAELYQRFITALAQKYSLTDDDYNLTADRLPQFSHFIVEDSGLHLYADQDSILAHVDGPADALVPWNNLSDIVAARFRK